MVQCLTQEHETCRKQFSFVLDLRRKLRIIRQKLIFVEKEKSKKLLDSELEKKLITVDSPFKSGSLGKLFSSSRIR